MFKRAGIVALVIATFVFFGNVFSGKAAIEDSSRRTTDSFQQMTDLSVGTLPAPTVVDVVFPLETSDFGGAQFENDVVIVSKTKNIPESSYSSRVALPAREFSPVLVVSAPASGMNQASGTALYDKSLTSYVEFSLPENGVSGMAVVAVRTATPEALSGFSFSLDNNVAMPTRVGVTATVDGVEKTVLSPVAIFSQQVLFPRTVAEEWNITFWYNQPLRITELSFSVETGSLLERHVKFLAQPGEEYRLYAKPDQQTALPRTAVAYNLSSVAPGVSLSVGTLQLNPYYRPTDTDADGIADMTDNCPRLANPQQEDINGNALGDACEDFDKDGLTNTVDNCPNLPNTNQKDTDSDGIGDMCDTLESRFTERHAWVPWVGMGTAVVVLITLFALTAKKTNRDDSGELS